MLRIYKIGDNPLIIAEQVRFEGINVFSVRDKIDYILVEIPLTVEVEIISMDNIVTIRYNGEKL